MYQKFFAAENERAARRAVIGMIIGVIVIESLLYGLAIIGSAKYFAQAPFAGPDGALNKAETETIILHVARFDLPQLAGGLMMAAAVAVILSTANTYLMIPSTNIARDLSLEAKGLISVGFLFLWADFLVRVHLSPNFQIEIFAPTPQTGLDIYLSLGYLYSLR